MSRIWIAWEYHPRNRSLSAALDAQLIEMVSSRNRLIKFPGFIGSTVAVLVKRRPAVLFVENPSVILAVLAVLLRPFLGYRLVVDEHSAGFFPIEGESRILNVLARFVVRRADFVIVTNRGMQELAHRWGGRAQICPDPLPDLSRYRDAPRPDDGGGAFNVFFVCSWTDDEPYAEVFEAVRDYSGSVAVRLWVSGNYTGKVDPGALPDTVELLGYVSNEEYYSRFARCDAAIVLTRRDDCLNCGAYEAVSLGKPGILANTGALKEYFNKGFVHADIDAGSIRTALEQVVESHSRLVDDVSTLYRELEVKSDRYIDHIDRLVKGYEPA